MMAWRRTLHLIHQASQTLAGVCSIMLLVVVRSRGGGSGRSGGDRGGAALGAGDRVLLFLLALASIPGSFLPQRGVNPVAVIEYYDSHPTLAPVLDRLGLFDSFAAPWFAAIYLLLFVSLVGCIIPRIRHHWQAMRARPPRTPKRLERLEGHVRSERAEGTVAEAVDTAEKTLKRAGYRTERYGDSVSAERGYLRETGNLVFHSALVGVLLGDVRLELALDGADLHLPDGEGVGDLLDRLDLVEEARELLELGPLVVGDGHGDVDVDGLDDLRHGGAPCCLTRCAAFRCCGRHARR